MKIDLTYDGHFLKWGDKALTFKASSGLPGHQIPGEQCTPDAGPLPEGLYKVYLADHGMAKDNGKGICALAPSWGIQEIPRGITAGLCEKYWANWGTIRARMEPADEKSRRHCAPISRGGFYLHDSAKGYSHGCIEVENGIFKYLRQYHSLTKKNTILLQINYKWSTTYGDTKK